MRQELDITRDVCPLTHVKVNKAMATVPPGEAMRVVLRPDALKAVMSSMKANGHRVAAAGRRDPDLLVIEVTRSG